MKFRLNQEVIVEFDGIRRGKIAKIQENDEYVVHIFSMGDLPRVFEAKNIKIYDGLTWYSDSEPKPTDWVLLRGCFTESGYTVAKWCTKTDSWGDGSFSYIPIPSIEWSSLPNLMVEYNWCVILDVEGNLREAIRKEKENQSVVIDYIETIGFYISAVTKTAAIEKAKEIYGVIYG